MNKEENERRATHEDAKLFLSFVKGAGGKCKVRHRSDVVSTHKKKAVKIRFKSVNSDVGGLMFYSPELPMIEKSTEYACTYCGAKYVYKRCLINHMVKNHRNKLL